MNNLCSIAKNGERRTKVQPLLVLDEVSLGERLKNVSAQFTSQGVSYIVGPNGSGKSTLLRLLSGLYSFNGSIFISGKSIKTCTRLTLARQRSYLEQRSGVGFDLRVSHYLMTIIEQLNVVGHTALPDVLTTLEQYFEIEVLLERRVHQLSGGEWQRVRLAGAFLQVSRRINADSRYLLLDEPFTGLDIRHQQLLHKACSDYAADGLLVVVAHHDLSDVIKFGHNVTVLKNGQLIVQGEPSSVLTEGRIDDVFEVKSKRVNVEGHWRFIW